MFGNFVWLVGQDVLWLSSIVVSYLLIQEHIGSYYREMITKYLITWLIITIFQFIFSWIETLNEPNKEMYEEYESNKENKEGQPKRKKIDYTTV